MTSDCRYLPGNIPPYDLPEFCRLFDPDLPAIDLDQTFVLKIREDANDGFRGSTYHLGKVVAGNCYGRLGVL